MAKSFGKYVILKHHLFDELKNSKIDTKTLTSEEKNLIGVLKDKKLSANERLQSYQYILFQALKKRMENSSKGTQTYDYKSEKAASQDMKEKETQTLSYFNRNPLTRTKSTAMGTSMFEDQEEEELRNPSNDFAPNRRNEDFFSSSQIAESPSPQKTVRFVDLNKDIYANDDQEIDISVEQDRLLNYARKNLSRGSEVKVNELLFGNIEDVNNSKIKVIDTITDESLQVDKSAKLFEQQQLAKRRPRGELSLLQDNVGSLAFPPSTFKRTTRTAAKVANASRGKLQSSNKSFGTTSSEDDKSFANTSSRNRKNRSKQKRLQKGKGWISFESL